MPETLLISQIRTDGATQPRAELDYGVIEEYSQAMRAGVVFPPVDVFYDGSEYWLADGFHRLAAAGGAELERIATTIHQGTREQAQWFSFGANGQHGLRRTNADKQRAVRAALAHPLSAGLSDREIGRHVGVDHKTVAAAKPASGEIPHPKKSSNTTKIDPAVPEVSGAEPVYEAGQGSTVPVTREKAPARTYHADPSTPEDPLDQEPVEEPPFEGIAGAVELIMAARRIVRVRLTNNERRYLASDLPGKQFMREARDLLSKELDGLESNDFTQTVGKPVEKEMVQ
jgi:hypothetical protein